MNVLYVVPYFSGNGVEHLPFLTSGRDETVRDDVTPAALSQLQFAF